MCILCLHNQCHFQDSTFCSSLFTYCSSLFTFCSSSYLLYSFSLCHLFLLYYFALLRLYVLFYIFLIIFPLSLLPLRLRNPFVLLLTIVFFSFIASHAFFFCPFYRLFSPLIFPDIASISSSSFYLLFLLYPVVFFFSFINLYSFISRFLVHFPLTTS